MPPFLDTSNCAMGQRSVHPGESGGRGRRLGGLLTRWVPRRYPEVLGSVLGRRRQVPEGGKVLGQLPSGYWRGPQTTRPKSSLIFAVVAGLGRVHTEGHGLQRGRGGEVFPGGGEGEGGYVGISDGGFLGGRKGSRHRDYCRRRSFPVSEGQDFRCCGRGRRGHEAVRSGVACGLRQVPVFVLVCLSFVGWP